MNNTITKEFQKLVDINTPIIVIEDFDFARVDAQIKEAIRFGTIEEWNPATGDTNFKNKEQRNPSSYVNLESFLLSRYKDELYTKERALVLKNIERYLDNPRVVSLLQMMAQRRLYDRSCNTYIILVSPSINLPEEVLKYASFLDIPFPDEKEIDELIESHVRENHCEEFDKENIPRLRESLKGLSRYDIDRVLDMAMSKNGTLSKEDNDMIRKQKKAMVKKSGLVEYIDSTLKIDDIGGLDYLKKYLTQKKAVMADLSTAKKQGVKTPKGIFIVGMPGCGKSLCAKAVADTFGIPLLKLDMGSMMGKYVGQSEKNLRDALKLAEATAPCVLWMDEIEKAFSGTGGHNDVLTRMFGYFLSWMQEKTSSVYVVATANSAENLPPELKRKGRFDEIFCVNLPNPKEREAIFNVHYKRLLSLGYPECSFENAAQKTEGFNGADIESVINETVETCYVNNDSFSSKYVLETIKKTTSISRSCGAQIKAMEEVFRSSCFVDATSGKLTNKVN